LPERLSDMEVAVLEQILRHSYSVEVGVRVRQPMLSLVDNEFRVGEADLTDLNGGPACNRWPTHLSSVDDVRVVCDLDGPAV
jgi:hypothetical protein